MLFTKSIFKPAEKRDGIRISVMSRHTLEDGITPDVRITSESYDFWNKTLSPPDRLVGSYYKKRFPWEEFERRYLAYLKRVYVTEHVRKLSKEALLEDITLLCAEESAEKCHRRILAEECQRYEPSLEVNHR